MARRNGSPAIASDGTLYFGSWDKTFYALHPNGTLKWKFAISYATESSPAIGADGTIYVGSGDGNLYAVNPDGTRKWAFATGSFVNSAPAVGADGTIYFGSGYPKANLYAVNPDGTRKWAFASGDGASFGSPAISATWPSPCRACRCNGCFSSCAARRRAPFPTAITSSSPPSSECISRWSASRSRGP